MKIGIVAQNQPEDKFGVNTNYLRFIEEFGDPIIILPVNEDRFLDLYSLDALLLPGGQDINPVKYGKNMYGTGNSNPFLEYFDDKLLPKLIGKIPIFGICRGLQALNVHFGGTLKNLWYHPSSINDNHEAHKVHEPGNKDKKDLWGVNSFHHQAIDGLAKNLKTELISDDYLHVIEAVSDFERKIFCVQWHPERLDDDYSKNMFSRILK